MLFDVNQRPATQEYIGTKQCFLASSLIKEAKEVLFQDMEPRQGLKQV